MGPVSFLLKGPSFALLIISIYPRLKTSGEQLDDRIVEVHWDPGNECWRMMRYRDDKPNGNHKSVVENVIKSIADGVEKDTVRIFSSSETSFPVLHLHSH